MTVRNVTIQFAADAEENAMAVVRDCDTHELLSVWDENDASELYYNLTRRNMGKDYNELRAVRSPTESSTEHS